jgi:hypothetical protein
MPAAAASRLSGLLSIATYFASGRAQVSHDLAAHPAEATDEVVVREGVHR